MTEGELVTSSRAGSTAAFTRLVEIYQAPIYNLCYRMLGDPGEAEDAAQEAFLRAYSQLHRYDPARPFKSWLFAIASHHCIDRLRRRHVTWLGIDDMHQTTVDPRLRILIFLPLLTTLVLSPCWVFADWSPLIDRLVADGFDETTIRTLFSRPEVTFEPSAMSSKLKELMEKVAGLPSDNQKVVYKSFLKENVITQAHSYLQDEH